jgi:hypothetical protein
MFWCSLVDTVLTFGPGNLGHPVAKGHWVIPRTARGAARKLFVAAIESAPLLATHQISLCAGPLISCLGAAKQIASPGGALRSTAGAGPSWVWGTRAMPSGEI